MRKERPKGLNHLNLQRRKDGPRLLIDGGIAISFYRVRGNKIWLRIEAPGHVDVWREEVAPEEFLARQEIHKRGAA